MATKFDSEAIAKRFLSKIPSEEKQENKDVKDEKKDEVVQAKPKSDTVKKQQPAKAMEEPKKNCGFWITETQDVNLSIVAANSKRITGQKLDRSTIVRLALDEWFKGNGKKYL